MLPNKCSLNGIPFVLKKIERTDGQTDKQMDGPSDYVMPQILTGVHKNW